MNTEHLGFFFFRGYLKNDVYHYPSGEKKIYANKYRYRNVTTRSTRIRRYYMACRSLCHCTSLIYH